MKTRKSGIMTILMGLLLIIRAAAAEGTGDGNEADHAALRALMANAAQAINSQDMDKLTSCFTKDFVFTTVDQSVLTNTLSLKRYYDRMLHREDSPVTGYQMAPRADIPTIFLDTNTGFVYGTSDDTYTLRENGRKVPMTCQWTAAVVRENGAWKVAAVHSGVNVMKNPVIDTIVKSMWRYVMAAAGIGVLAGLGIGIVLARSMRKNPR